MDKSSPNKKLSLFACNLLQVISSAHKMRLNTSANVTNNCLTSRFYGLFDIKIADPVLFYVSSVSRQITDGQPFTLQDVAQGTLRQNIAPKSRLPLPNIPTKTRLISIASMPIKTPLTNSLNKRSTRFGQVSTGLKQLISCLKTSATTKKVLISFASLIASSWQ